MKYLPAFLIIVLLAASCTIAPRRGKGSGQLSPDSERMEPIRFPTDSEAVRPDSLR